MSGNPFAKATSGSDVFGSGLFSATRKNAVDDVVAAHRGGQFDRGGRADLPFRSSTLVRVKNISGEDVVRGGVLGIGGPIIAAGDNLAEYLRAPTFDGLLPSNPSHRGRFVVTLEPIADDGIGLCCIEGVCHVRKLTDVNGSWEFADIADGTTGELQRSVYGSAEVLSFSSSTERAVVRLRSNNRGLLYGVVDKSDHIAAGASGTIKLEGSSEPIEAKNRTGHTAWDGAAVDVLYNRIADEWAIVQSNACTRLRGKLVGAMEDTDLTHTIDNLIALDKSHYPIIDTSTIVTASNIHKWRGDDNAAARAEWNETDQQWELYMEDCPTS